MKKLNIVVNGHPRTNHDLLHLQDAIIEVATAYGKLCANDAGDPVLISGAIFTNVGGGAFTISDAWWFINGEVFYMPAVAASFSPPDWLRISSTFAVNNPYLGHNIHNIRQVLPVTGAFVAGDIDFLTAIQNVATDNILARATAKGWVNINAAGSAFFPQYKAGIINVAANTGQYRKTGAGLYEFRGIADVGGCVAVSLGGYQAIDFGAGAMTTTTKQYGCCNAKLNTLNKPCSYEVNTGGIYISHDAGYSLIAGDELRLSGIRFYHSY